MNGIYAAGHFVNRHLILRHLTTYNIFVACNQTSVKDDADANAITDDRKEGRQHKKYAQHLSLKFESIISIAKDFL